MSCFDNSITCMKGIGEKRAQLFSKIGVRTVGNLLYLFPRAYQDFSAPLKIAESRPGELCCISGAVTEPVRSVPVRRKGMTLYKTRVADDSGECALVFFNNRYIMNLLRRGETYCFYGRMGGSLLQREMISPVFEPVAGSPGLLPIYPSTEGLPSRVIRGAVKDALSLLDETVDPLPGSVRSRYHLCHLRYALEGIHFPSSSEDLESARRRLVFEELLTFQLGILFLKSRNREGSSAPACGLPADLGDFYAGLPFEPTEAQRRAIAEAAGDMRSSRPMNRLLEGDVGSGKTVVAAALCRYAAACSLQSAIMAPTEILAAQHWRTVSSLLESCGVRVGLLTGSMKASDKLKIKEQLAGRQIDVMVGTHALLQEDVDFPMLGLVITDEQHRFGVMQRAALAAKGKSPHVLIMSATPIPRTLGLTLYGDLDISVLDTLPSGRHAVKTYLVDTGKRGRIYAFIRRHLDKGLQAYIVCPLIESGEDGLSSAEEYASQLIRGPFGDYRVGLLHGKMEPREKDRVMSEFAQGELQLLVSTTVIEVGVDVPNAVIMAIENAERFGLSQLHQLRGRVGRGSEQSYCILISDTDSEDTRKRLSILTKVNDGFEIAEQDLRLRGPGDFFGQRQHGLPPMRIADLTRDISELKDAHECAASILKEDPRLETAENRPLRALVSNLFSSDVIAFN